MDESYSVTFTRPGSYSRNLVNGQNGERFSTEPTDSVIVLPMNPNKHHSLSNGTSEVTEVPIPAGPDPLLIQSNPEGQEVFHEDRVLQPTDPDLPPKYTVSAPAVMFPKKFPGEFVGPLPSTFDSAEDVLLLLENPGRFQLIQFILMCLMYFTLSFNDLIPLIYNVVPIVNCVDPTFGLKENETAPVDYCYCAPAGVKYTYPDSERQWSVIADMNLICERATYASLPTTLYFLGNLVAGPSSGSLADAIGRRKALMISVIVYTLASLGCIFSRDLISFCILRFIVGMGRQGIHSVSFVLMLEWMTPWRRGPGCAIAVFFITLGALVLALLSYLIQNWWYIQIILTVSCVWYIGLIWFGPESLKWLLLNNRPEEAKSVVRKIAKFNNVVVPEAVYARLGDIAASLHILKNDGKPYTVGDWFRQNAIRRFILCSCWIWFASFIVYLCYNLKVPPFTTSLYANLAIGAALELFARLVAVIVSRFCGNRRPLMYYFIIGGSLALLAGFIPGADISGRIAKAVILVIGRMVIAMCSSVQFVYVQELFPTIVRNSAFGLCSVAYRIGDILGSFLVLLATVRTCAIDGVSSSGLDLEIMGLIALLGAVTTYFLPETRGKKMPETIQATEFRQEEINALHDKYEADVKKIQ